MESFCLFGAGGHAKVVASAIEAAGDRVVCMVRDDEPVPPEAKKIVIAIGDNRTRRLIDHSHLDLVWGIAIHPSATVHDSAVVREGTQILYNAVVEPDAKIGRHVIINSGATVAHDCVIGD